MGWVGLGHSADGLRWIGSHKMDPWTTVGHHGVTLGGTASRRHNVLPVLLVHRSPRQTGGGLDRCCRRAEISLTERIRWLYPGEIIVIEWINI